MSEKNNKKKLLAIRSATLINRLSTQISPSLPIGLAYILGAIKNKNLDIKAIDALGESPFMKDAKIFSKKNLILGLDNDQILFKIGDFNPDIILITSMFSPDWLILRDLIFKLKSKYPKSIIIGGGEHFSAMPEFCFNESLIDCIVTGEGEETIKEIIDKIIDNNFLVTKIKGTYKRINGKIEYGGDRERVRCLKNMPWPAWEYFNINNMLDNGIGNTSNQKKNIRPMPLNATRGCPYRCTFCSNPQMWGKLWRARPADDVVKEIKYLNKNFGANHFDFTDLTLAVKKDWLIEFCNEMIKAKMKITWGLPSGTRSEVLDFPILKLLKQAGLNDIDYAPESGSEKILKIMKKQIKIENLLSSIKSANKVGLKIKVNIILGYPEETRRDILDTMWFAIKCAYYGADDMLVTALSIYPGSEIHSQVTNERNIVYNDDYFETLTDQGSLNLSECYSNHYSKHELFLFKYLTFIIFYLSSFLFKPKKTFILIRDLIKMQGSTRLSMALINFIRRVKIKNRTT